MRRRLTWPRSLRGQMILLLLAVLVIVQGVSIALFVGERDRAIRIATAKEAASRLLNVARELEVVPGSMQETLLRATESRDLQLSLDTAALARAADAQRLERLTRKVARIVDPPAHRQFEIALGRPDLQAGLPEDHQGDWDGDPYELVLSVSLSDGVWLNARIDIGRPPFQWAWPAFVSIALTVVAVVAVVWLLVSRIAGPMSALAAAAEGLGRGEALEPLALKGPVEVCRVTDAFNDMADRLTRLLAERSRMLAAIGHDLRSPITAMRIRLEMVEDEESRQRLETCLDEIQTLVEAALALAQGTSTSEPRRRLLLGDLLRDVIEEMRELGSNASLKVIDEAEVAARPASLKRAFRNIVENAIRYGGEAAVVLRRKRGEAWVEIVDRGPGIPEAERERVFEPFVRLEASRSRETGGAGLGLAIAKAVIDSHGGGVALDAAPDGGTRVGIRLPLHAVGD